MARISKIPTLSFKACVCLLRKMLHFSVVALLEKVVVVEKKLAHRIPQSEMS